MAAAPPSSPACRALGRTRPTAAPAASASSRRSPPRPARTRSFPSRIPASPTTCPPNGSPVTAPPTPGADDDRRPDHRSALQQLADHHEQLTQLTDLITGIGGTLREHAAALAKLAESPPADADQDRYRPSASSTWWKLAADDRQEPIARLQAWVEQVYRPGYGHLAATLAPCWTSHDLCLYGLDILAELWSVLYLGPERTPRMLSAQAEYQARILPALAAQLMTETSSCGHTLPHLRRRS